MPANSHSQEAILYNIILTIANLYEINEIHLVNISSNDLSHDPLRFKISSNYMPDYVCYTT